MTNTWLEAKLKTYKFYKDNVETTLSLANNVMQYKVCDSATYPSGKQTLTLRIEDMVFENEYISDWNTFIKPWGYDLVFFYWNARYDNNLPDHYHYEWHENISTADGTATCTIAAG